MNRWWPGLALCAVVLSGCAAGAATPGAGSGPVADLVSGLAPLHSGVLDFEVVSQPGTVGSQGGVGYRLSGPFGDPPPGQSLPLLHLTIEPIGTGGAAVTVVSNGNQASIVQPSGARTTLTAAQAAQLAAGVRPGGDLTGVRQLDLASWAQGKETRSRTTIDGTTVDQVESSVDPVTALNGVERVLAGTIGAAATQPVDPGSQAATQIRKAVESSRLTVEAGATDHLIRLIELDLTFAAPATGPLRAALGPLGGLRIQMRVQVSDPNRPVTVTP